MWENILKRRPLKINKPKKVTSPEEIDEIHKDAVSFLTDITIMDLYMEYLESLPDDAEPSHNLNNALFSSINYANRALEKTQPTQRLIFEGNKISLLELFNDLYDIILEALDKLTDLDRASLKRLIKYFEDFLDKNDEYLDHQHKLYRAERGKPNPDNPTYPSLPENPW